MNIPDKMKLNRFRPTVIPKGREYYARFGAVSVSSGRYSGDEMLPPVDKISSLADIQRQIDEIQAKERPED